MILNIRTDRSGQTVKTQAIRDTVMILNIRTDRSGQTVKTRPLGIP